MAKLLSAVQVLTIIAERLQKRADALEGVRLEGYSVTIEELRRFAEMVRNARNYLEQQTGPPSRRRTG